jgi:uncharacterized membrane protein
MLTLAAVTGLSVFWIIGAILLVTAVWFILKIALEEPGSNSVIDRIRKRYSKGEIGEENFDERLHHLI